jgi:hypothetical protein
LVSDDGPHSLTFKTVAIAFFETAYLLRSVRENASNSNRS